MRPPSSFEASPAAGQPIDAPHRPARDALYWLTIAAAITIPVHALPKIGGFTLSVGDLLSLVFVVLALPLMLANLLRPVVQVLALWLLVTYGTTLLASLSMSVDFDKFFVQMLKNLISAGYFLIFYTIFRMRPALMTVFATTTIYVMAVWAAIAAFEVFILSNTPRATMPFTNPNAFAAYIVFALAMAFAFNSAVKTRALHFAIIASLLLGLLATGSRSAVLSLAIGFASWLLFALWRGAPSVKGRNALYSILLSLGALAGAGYGVLQTVTSQGDDSGLRAFTVDTETVRDAIRFRIWENAVESFNSSPIYGVGLGQYGFSDTALDVGLATHNTYLSYLAETGLIGFAALMIPLVVLFMRLAKIRPALQLREAMLLYLPAVATHAFFTNIDNFRIVWIGLAIAVCTVHLAKTSSTGNAAWGMTPSGLARSPMFKPRR
jgi:O-antigen ligase